MSLYISFNSSDFLAAPKYLLTPFNRISKTNRCVKCNKEVNNIERETKKEQQIFSAVLTHRIFSSIF